MSAGVGPERRQVALAELPVAGGGVDPDLLGPGRPGNDARDRGPAQQPRQGHLGRVAVVGGGKGLNRLDYVEVLVGQEPR